MVYNPEKHHRRSIRLKGYDYSRAGAYFVTVCVQNRECLFGEIAGRIMRPNGAGQMVGSVWDELPQYYPGVGTDEFVVMPNHIHGIIVLTGAGADPCACPRSVHRQGTGESQERGQPQGVAPTAMSLPDVLNRFKSFTTTRYRQGIKHQNWSRFSGRLWQRNYHDHIIRNEAELNRIRQYIAENPARWTEGEDNPLNWPKC